jgi:single-strand DNA-binding protein
MSDNITIAGNLAADPELRFSPHGTAVVNLRVASDSRIKNKNGEWGAGPTTFWNVVAWDILAENVAESLTKGTGVIIVGTVGSREWEDQKTGEKRTVFEIKAEKIGAELRFATVKVTRTPKKTRNDADYLSGNATETTTISRHSGPIQNDPWDNTQQGTVPF